MILMMIIIVITIAIMIIMIKITLIIAVVIINSLFKLWDFPLNPPLNVTNMFRNFTKNYYLLVFGSLKSSYNSGISVISVTL